MHDNFETNQGWTAVNLGATTGDWERGVPVNDPDWDYDPISDSDGSGRCFLTENRLGNTDVDDGAVQLTSPTIDMSSAGIAISYDYYLYLTDPNSTDHLLVEIDTNGGAGPWTQIADHVTSGDLNWRTHVIDQAALSAAGVTPTSTTVLRFTANDASPQSINESGLDAFLVTSFDCTSPCPGADGDMNGVGGTDGEDLEVFVRAVLGPATAYEICHGDFTGDGVLDVADVPGMVAAALGM
jgi:hypothetical protein